VARRLTDIQGRGVALKDGQTLLDLYNERASLYRQYSDLTIVEGDGSLEDTVRSVFNAVGDSSAEV